MMYDTSGFSPMKLGYRNTRCHWGTHIACLYQTEEERDQLVGGFMSRGLQDGNFLLYCPAEQGEKNFKKTLLNNCPEFRVHIDDPERIHIISVEDSYYPEGKFSREGMDKTLLTLYERQFQKQHRNIRVATEMTWALKEFTKNGDLVMFEEEMNLLIPNRKIVSLCLYNLNKFSNELILRVLRTHPYTMSKGILTRSSYYEPPTHYMNIDERHSHNFQHASGI
jgi:hypothetical protein